MEILLCMEILHRLSKYKFDTKMLRLHLFSIFTIKTQQAHPALAPFSILIS